MVRSPLSVWGVTAIVVAAFLIAGCNQQTGGTKPATAAPGSSSTSPAPALAALQALVASQSASADKANTDPAGFAWDLFVYVNWPAMTDPSQRGMPDPSKPFGQPGAVVWETWKNTDETFQPNGVAPASWTTAEPVPPAVKQKPILPSDSGNFWQDMTGNSEVDGFPALDDMKQEILYEIRQNQSTFDYITGKSLYSIDGQIAYAKNSGALQFDWSALEVKASWRWLDTTKPGCQASDYFTANAYWPEKDKNGNFTGYKTGVMGLTGLHIISKALPQWVWITFEQVNNTTCTEVTRRDPIPANIAALNVKMQQALANTKWKNYELVGVQTSAGTADQPVLLANTQIETAFQSRSSCLTCHAIANIAKVKPANPAGNLRKSFIQSKPPVSPPYYVGPPPALEPYESQDFVWSLRRAQWKKN
jgi:hypothetical protein